MRAMNRQEAAQWCRDRGITFRGPNEPGYGLPPIRRLDLRLPTSTAALIYVARLLTMLESRAIYTSLGPERPFEGCLVWIIDHATWSTASQEVGLYAFTQLCAPVSEPSAAAPTLERQPAYLFDEHEATHAIAALLQPLLFQWDALIVPASGNYIARMCHDGYIRGIIVRTPEMLDQVKSLFVDFSIEEGIPWKQSRIRKRI